MDYHSGSAGEIIIEAASDRTVDWPATRLRVVRRARRLLGIGGALLAAGFFMPAVEGCSAPLVPVKEVYEVAQSPELGDLFAGFLFFVAPYLFGLMMLVAALRGRSLRRTHERRLGVPAMVLFGLVAVPLGLWTIAHLALEGLPALDWDSLLFSVIAVLSALYFLRSLRVGPGGVLAVRWYASLCCVLWFSFWLVALETYYGLWISLAGALCMVFANTAETRARCQITWGHALWRLLCCRVQLYDLDAPRCLHCGYPRAGLRSPRCPECGREFTGEGDDVRGQALAQTDS